ncbi:MAG: LacI family DNA-binding transcriptional regulator [Solobacterium sp.]|nr:LacI family DNA-binding transcriptional regulator [Solobacterium sp.]MBR3343984.1 LacI family DNA-binding transcriptional regulator [Solobacterium sp.]
MNKRAGIVDVAKMAGVSTATVSHVINNTRFVTDDTRERVNQAIRELGYAPNASARTLKTGKTNKIQFIIPDVDNAFFTSLIESIESVLSKHGYQLLLVNTHENWDTELSYLRTVNSSVVDGLILATTQTDWKTLKENLPSDLPVVLVDRKPDGCSIDCVWISTYDACYEAVNKLIQWGHKKIGLIAARPNLSTSVERNQAYTDSITEGSLEQYIAPGDSLRNSSPKHYQELIKQGCTAILVANGRMTDDIIYYQYEHPEEMQRNITLAGFRESSKVHRLTPIAISQPSEKMGEYAAERILALIKNSHRKPKENILHAVCEIRCDFAE